MSEPAARWPVPLAFGPYVLLALLTWLTVAINGLVLADLVVCALLAAWMLVLFTLRPAWRGRAAMMAMFVAGLIVLTAALVVRAPWFGFFTPAAYVFTFRLLPWPWQQVGVGAVAVVAGTAQAYGVDKGTAAGLVTYVAVVLANVGPMCAFAAFARRSARQDEERERALLEAREANRKLAASLAENAALHERLLAQARDAGVRDERQRMAREIHDTLAQGLTGIISQLRAAEHAADAPPAGDLRGGDPPGGDAAGVGPESGDVTDVNPAAANPAGGDGAGGDGAGGDGAGGDGAGGDGAGGDRAGGDRAGRDGRRGDSAEGALTGWRRHVAAAAKLAGESLAEARRSVHALRPEPLRSAQLGEALAGVAERWSVLHEIPVQVTTTGTARPIRPEAEAALLRIAQEALANVAQHARATRVGVTLSYLEHETALDVRDDGGGFDPARLETAAPRADRGGFGLIAMRQRMESLSGTLQIESEPGTGTGISARVPAEHAETCT